MKGGRAYFDAPDELVHIVFEPFEDHDTRVAGQETGWSVRSDVYCDTTAYPILAIAQTFSSVDQCCMSFLFELANKWCAHNKALFNRSRVGPCSSFGGA